MIVYRRDVPDKTNCMCYDTEIELADQTCHVTNLQRTDTGSIDTLSCFSATIQKNGCRGAMK